MDNIFNPFALLKKIRRKHGEEKYWQMMSFQERILKAIMSNNNEELEKIKNEMSKLEEKIELPNFFSSLTQSEMVIGNDTLQHSENDIYKLCKKVPSISKLLKDIFNGSSDVYERHSDDDRIVDKNIELFTDNTIDALLKEAERCISIEMLNFAERIYEITQHALRKKGYSRKEITIGLLAGNLCEKTKRYIGAMDWYDIVRRASKTINDDSEWIKATIKYAKAGIKYAPGGLDLQLIPTIEEALTLAEKTKNYDDLNECCDLLIQMYERQGKKTKIIEIKKRYNI